MKKLFSSTPLIALFALVSSNAYAVAVPEIDGANAAVALGLTAGVIALVREYRRRK